MTHAFQLDFGAPPALSTGPIPECLPSDPSCGPCCLGDDRFECKFTEFIDCDIAGGTWLGIDKGCGSCVGACCHEGDCADMFLSDCLAILDQEGRPGQHFGNAFRCADEPCQRACCINDYWARVRAGTLDSREYSRCNFLTTQECLDIPGGPGTDMGMNERFCSDGPCDEPCCTYSLKDGYWQEGIASFCDQRKRRDCPAFLPSPGNTSPRGFFVDHCDDGACTTACCESPLNGNCRHVTGWHCEQANDNPMPLETHCWRDGLPCQAGACCHCTATGSGGCTVMSSEDCRELILQDRGFSFHSGEPCTDSLCVDKKPCCTFCGLCLGEMTIEQCAELDPTNISYSYCGGQCDRSEGTDGSEYFLHGPARSTKQCVNFLGGNCEYFTATPWIDSATHQSPAARSHDLVHLGLPQHGTFDRDCGRHFMELRLMTEPDGSVFNFRFCDFVDTNLSGVPERATVMRHCIVAIRPLSGIFEMFQFSSVPFNHAVIFCGHPCPCVCV